MSKETFTGYVTKYALSSGIKKVQLETCHVESMVSEVAKLPGMLSQNYHGDDWHRTFAQAKAKAEEMRRRKIASLQKQIAKLEKLEFTA